MVYTEFGLVADINQNGDGYLTDRVGNAQDMSPEMLMQQRYRGVLCDIFALGVSLFTILTGRPPWKRATRADPLYKLILEDRIDRFWTNWTDRM